MDLSPALTEYLTRKCGPKFALLRSAEITAAQRLGFVYALGGKLFGPHAERLKSTAITEGGQVEADEWLMAAASGTGLEAMADMPDAARKALLERFTRRLLALMTAEKVDPSAVTLRLPLALREDDRAFAALLLALSRPEAANQR